MLGQSENNHYILDEISTNGGPAIDLKLALNRAPCKTPAELISMDWLEIVVNKSREICQPGTFIVLKIKILRDW